MYDIKRLKRGFKFSAKRTLASGTIHCTLIQGDQKFVIYNMDFSPKVTCLSPAAEFFQKAVVKVPELQPKENPRSTEARYKDQSFNPYVPVRV